jgi:hypothetical protein
MQASAVFEARDPSLALSRVVAGVAIALSLVHAAAAQTASGHFSSRTLDVPIAGSYSYWDRASGDKGRLVKVAVSNAGFRASMLDDWQDRGAAIHELFASDEVKVVYFDFDPDGRYRGYSYYFASGDGCGWCYDSTVHSTVRGAHGRLSGSIAFNGGPDSVAFDVTFDVPIPDKTWGKALPAGGGAPGRAYLAYHKALAAGDGAALNAVSDDHGKELLSKHEKLGDLDEYLGYRWNETHYRMQRVTVSGGFVRGDRAVILFDGNSKMFDRLHGEAVLRRDGGTWRVAEELVQIGKRDGP